VARNKQQHAKILADDFSGWSLDEILMQLDGPRKDDQYIDPRNCLVIWARPSTPVRDLISFIQNELKSVAPGKITSFHYMTELFLNMGLYLTEIITALWLMPLANLHLTVLEVAHSLTEEEIEKFVQILQSSKDVTSSQIAKHPLYHPTRLIKPMLSFDSAALALSFVPAAGDHPEGDSAGKANPYTYHHLRRDIFDMVRQSNVPVASRYSVPSAHLTIARFTTQDGFTTDEGDGIEKFDGSRSRLFIDKIDEINKKLESEYWPREGSIKEGGEFIVGQECLVIRRGRVWYGGGEDVPLH
jgi:hypothetical protein